MLRRHRTVLVSAALALLALANGSPASAESRNGPVLVEADVGVDFVYFNGMSGELYLPEIMGGGAALLDYDGDGDLDLYLVQGAMLGPGKTLADATLPAPEDPPRDRLYRNELDPAAGATSLRFVDVTESSGIRATGYGMGVTAADFDNDGHVDLYLANLGENELWHNRGDGTFERSADPATRDPSWSIAAAPIDYDRDGWLDLYVVNYLDFAFHRHRRCLSPIAEPDYCGPLSYPPAADRLLHNRGDGTFEDVTEAMGLAVEPHRGLGVAVADFDHDGWLDLYVANDQMANWLWLNEEGKRFREEALLAGAALDRLGQVQASMGVDAADFDDDGDTDLFMTHLREEWNTLYVNDGSGTFADLTHRAGLDTPSWNYTGFGTVWLDLDRDGDLDLVTVNGAIKAIEALRRVDDPFPLHQTNQLFRNRGDGTFDEITALGGAAFERSEVSRGLAAGDLDNDGDTDLVVVNVAAPARLLLNTSAGGPWLGLRLVDADSGRDLLGSRVALLDGDGRPQRWRRVRSDGSYASSHDPRVLFALDPAVEGPVEVEVHWVDGRVERFPVSADRYQTLVRGRGGRSGDGGPP